MKKAFILGSLLFALGTFGVSAQTMMDLSSIDLSVNQIQQRIFLRHSVERAAARREAARKAVRGSGKAAQGSAVAAKQASGATTFRPVAPSLMPQQLASQMAKTPAERGRLERMFSQLLENYRNNLRRSNAPSNDVARAASYLIAASYMVYRDAAPLDDAQYKALREQMRETFAEDEDFQRLSDREKQQMFEGYGIAGTWIDAGYQIVKQADDRKAMAQWREMARRNLEGMLGTSPENIRFTDSGVEY